MTRRGRKHCHAKLVLSLLLPCWCARSEYGYLSLAFFVQSIGDQQIQNTIIDSDHSETIVAQQGPSAEPYVSFHKTESDDPT